MRRGGWRRTLRTCLIAGFLLPATQLLPGCTPAQLPDLTINYLDQVPTTAAPGQPSSLRIWVLNQSANPAPASTVGLWLQSAAFPTADKVPVILLSVPPLAAHTQTPVEAKLTVPATIPLGPYTAIACADPYDFVQEFSDTDNCNGSNTNIAVDNARSLNLATFRQMVSDPNTGTLFVSGGAATPDSRPSLLAFDVNGKALGSVGQLTGTWGLALSPTKHLLFAAQPAAHEIAVIDTDTRTVIGQIATPGDQPYWPTLAGQRLWVGLVESRYPGTNRAYDMLTGPISATATLTRLATAAGLDDATWSVPMRLRSAGESLPTLITDVEPYTNGNMVTYQVSKGQLGTPHIVGGYDVGTIAVTPDGASFFEMNTANINADWFRSSDGKYLGSVSLQATFSAAEPCIWNALAMTPDGTGLIGGDGPALTPIHGGQTTRLADVGCQYQDGLTRDATGHRIYDVSYGLTSPILHVQQW